MLFNRPIFLEITPYLAKSPQRCLKEELLGNAGARPIPFSSLIDAVGWCHDCRFQPRATVTRAALDIGTVTTAMAAVTCAWNGYF